MNLTEAIKPYIKEAREFTAHQSVIGLKDLLKLIDQLSDQTIISEDDFISGWEDDEQQDNFFI